MKGLGILLIVGLFLFGSYSCEAYRFHECKKVGHGTFYCIMDIGK
jgi:hypothetical protein